MMVADKETIMNAVSSLGFEVFRNGQFHWESVNTPDMYINQDGSIHCWTSSPFKDNTNNHGDLIDFVQMINKSSFVEAKKEAERLTGLTLPSLDTYKDNGYTIDNTNRKTGFIDEEFIKNFEVGRYENFERFKVLLNEALPSLDFDKQKELALKYQIGYIEMSDRLSMPIKDEENRIVTLWKYNKNPSSYKNEAGIEITPSKVLFTKGRDRCPFNLYDMQEFKKDVSQEVFLCAGEKDTLNMIGNGFRAVTLGAENENLKDKYKSFFQDLKIVIAYDNDVPGEKGTVKIFEQLKEVAKEVKVFDWNEAKKQGIELNKGFDMTDYLVQLKKLNLDFNKNFKDESYINELKSKLELEKTKAQNTNKKNNTEGNKMAVLKLVGKNDSLNIQADNGLQYTKDGEVKERKSLTAFLDVVKEGASVVDMNKGVVTLNLKVGADYHNFFVNTDKETGSIILKPTQDAKNEDLFIIFDKKTKQDGGSYFQLNNHNNANVLIDGIEITQTQNGAKYLGVTLNLKNDDLKAELQKAGKDHSAILSKAGYEIKHNLDLYRRDNSGVQNIKADVKQNETPKSNYGAMDSIRNEMNSSQVKEEAAQTNTQVEKNSNAGMVNFNFNIPSSNKEVIAAFESLMKALKVQNIDTNVEVKKQDTTQQQGYGARTQK